jgi:hypothetical protein
MAGMAGKEGSGKTQLEAKSRTSGADFIGSAARLKRLRKKYLLMCSDLQGLKPNSIKALTARLKLFCFRTSVTQRSHYIRYTL